MTLVAKCILQLIPEGNERTRMENDQAHSLMYKDHEDFLEHSPFAEACHVESASLINDRITPNWSFQMA